MVKTYVLVGYDHNDAFDESVQQWTKRAKEKGDVELLYAQPGESMAHLASRIKEKPAHLIWAAHGDSDGSFQWNKEKSYGYDELFCKLPRTGIDLVMIGGCYGELALLGMNGLPDGTILQARNGRKVLGWGGSRDRMSKEISSHPEITSLSIMLEALDNVDPYLYQKWHEDKVKRDPQAAYKKGMPATLDPNDVLPQLIGIGGTPPITLDLDEQMKTLSRHGQTGCFIKAHRPAFKRAIADVKRHFDVNQGDGTVWDVLSDIGINPLSMDKAVDAVATKLEAGADTREFTLKEKRIGYALTIALLHESGEIARLRKKACANTAPAPWYASEVKWSGHGDEQIAKLQAIAEKVFYLGTDKGGWSDGRVDGLNGERTKMAIEKMQDSYLLNHDTDYTKLMDRLVRDPMVMDAFGSLKLANGNRVANVTLSPGQPDKGGHGY